MDTAFGELAIGVEAGDHPHRVVTDLALQLPVKRQLLQQIVAGGELFGRAQPGQRRGRVTTRGGQHGCGDDFIIANPPDNDHTNLGPG